MPEIPDLSKLKNGNEPPPAENPEPTETTTRFAFLVTVGVDGNVAVSTDTGHEVREVCTTDDIYMACALIQKDIQVQQTAGFVSQGLLQMGSMMQHAQADKQIRQHLKL